MKIAIIGAGNMGGATALALAKSEALPTSNITVTTAHQETLNKYVNLGFTTTLDNKSAVKEADIIILSVKPWLIKPVIDEIVGSIDLKKQLIVNMAAGIPGEEMMSWLTRDTDITPNLIYVIPNTAIEVLESMTFIAPIHADEGQVNLVKSLFEKLGDCIVTDENHLSAGTALASCGIAYAFRYIRAASEAGVELGFKAALSARIVAQTVKGAAVLLDAHGSHPEEEIDKVTTPGGITIKGLNEMEKHGFTNSVICGLKAAHK